MFRKKNRNINNEPILIPYRKGDKWGYCDKDKNIVIPCIFSYANPFIDSFAKVSYKGKMGVINSKGSLVIPCIYTPLWEVDTLNKYGICIGRRGEFYFIVDFNGKELVESIYTSCMPSIISEGVINFGKNINIEEPFKTSWGLVDFNGNELTSFIYSNPFGHQNKINVGDGYAIQYKNGSPIYFKVCQNIDIRSKIVTTLIQCDISEIFNFSR